ncbi:MAG: hypothetical protein KIH67_001040 [Candidatus Moranbacteria bacterium]|nr:hypothetical protein [Candidatus Moranbacteria bacterium]
MSFIEEASALAARLNAKYGGGKGRVVAHPDVIVDSKLTCQDANRLREIQRDRIRELQTVPVLKRGSG